MQIAHASWAAARALPHGCWRTDVAPFGRWHPAHASSELKRTRKAAFSAQSKVGVGGDCQLAVAIERLGAYVAAAQ